MQEKLYLLKIGELILKGGNKGVFEKALVRNLALKLKGSGAQINTQEGRFYVHAPPGSAAQVEFALDHLAGITGWAEVRQCPKDIDEILKTCVEEARVCAGAPAPHTPPAPPAPPAEPQTANGKGTRTFKVEARRTDKSFPFDSYRINCLAGDAIRAALPEFRVDVQNPEFVFRIEVRERVYVWAPEHRGLRGLPVGTAGRGLLLLSGGIDSPVAGFLMALRGMNISALYFDAYPYTSIEAREKVITLSKKLSAYTQGLKLLVVSFTKVEERIRTLAPENWATVLLRMAMFECASLIARSRKCKALVTGESLSQVASQTIENIAAAGSRASLPILRPLIGLDKEEIIRRAVKLGTYSTSILPYADCCTLFSPQHPILHANLSEATKIYESLDLSDLLKEACACNVFSFPP